MCRLLARGLRQEVPGNAKGILKASPAAAAAAGTAGTPGAGLAAAAHGAAGAASAATATAVTTGTTAAAATAPGPAVLPCPPCCPVASRIVPEGSALSISASLISSSSLVLFIKIVEHP
ncbi:hypothetical protein AOQ84DRAFT_359165 [Glonium stellatum]|uniref:Uncharacterized protein n=1 Tax=Glonium stellatum TaxID=574774 RepID=A0A8E2FCW0_9PEZI|nr:hypothetical protein AOQ84DRAFT_359165 [Glonium stellatum]